MAFARARTDDTVEAIVFDVVVAPAHRGTGLGDRLVTAILEAPTLATVEQVERYCREDVVGFDARHGSGRAVDGLLSLRFER